jgi:outer membrane biosynthesis protein TonB
MYRISAKNIASRVHVSRGGARLRRLPTLVLRTGQAIKLAPGRDVVITSEAFQENLLLLQSYEEIIDVHEHPGGALVSLHAAPAPEPAPEPAPVHEPVVEPAPVVNEPVVELPIEPVDEPVVIEEPVEESVVTEDPIEEPVAVEEPPKKKGRRKKKESS